MIVKEICEEKVREKKSAVTTDEDRHGGSEVWESEVQVGLELVRDLLAALDAGRGYFDSLVVSAPHQLNNELRTVADDSKI